MSLPKGFILPCGLAVRVRDYVRIWRQVKAMPPAGHVRGWQWYTCTAAEALAEIRRGLHDRINRRGGLVVRQMPPDWDWDLIEVRAYRERRVVSRGSGLRTARARRRFPDVHEAMTSRD